MVDEPDVTEEEVKTMIAEGTEAGVFEKAEQEIIERLLSVADRSVRSIMQPRPEIVWLDTTETQERIYEDIVKSGHSRFPVGRGDVDDTIGIVHAKTLLEQLHNKGEIKLEAAIKAPLYVHESTNVLKLLEMFKSSMVHMAIVLDEHGSVQGIVTPTDILTSIAGELPEAGEDEPGAMRREDGSWLLDAQMPVFEVERVLGVEGLRSTMRSIRRLRASCFSSLGISRRLARLFSGRTGALKSWTSTGAASIRCWPRRFCRRLAGARNDGAAARQYLMRRAARGMTLTQR